MSIHPTVTPDRLMDMIEEGEDNLGSPGVCFACGTEAEGVEPDARKYRCGQCGENDVYGAEEALLMVA